MFDITPLDLLESAVDRIRRFDRFYNKLIDDGHTAAAMEDFTAAQTRTFHELGMAGACSAAWLNLRLGLDPAYLHRILEVLRAYDLVTVAGSPRRREWDLTERGQKFFEHVEAAYRERAREIVKPLPQRQRDRLIQAMEVIEEVLTRKPMENFLDQQRELLASARPATDTTPHTAAPRTT